MGSVAEEIRHSPGRNPGETRARISPAVPRNDNGTLKTAVKCHTACNCVQMNGTLTCFLFACRPGGSENRGIKETMLTTCWKDRCRAKSRPLLSGAECLHWRDRQKLPILFTKFRNLYRIPAIPFRGSGLGRWVTASSVVRHRHLYLGFSVGWNENYWSSRHLRMGSTLYHKLLLNIIYDKLAMTSYLENQMQRIE